MLQNLEEKPSNWAKSWAIETREMNSHALVELQPDIEEDIHEEEEEQEESRSDGWW